MIPELPESEAQPVALPLARMPVGALPVEHRVGVDARAVAVAALPVMLNPPVPVRLVTTPDAGVPRAGVTRVGDVANTAAPVPVSSVMAAARLALDGVPRKVATPAPKPLTPVPIGKPVAFVKTPEAGVPSAGVINVGAVRVRPAIVVVVELEAMDVLPIVMGNPLLPPEYCGIFNVPAEKVAAPLDPVVVRLKGYGIPPKVCAPVHAFAWVRFTSSVVADEVPPTVIVLFGLLIESPPAADPNCVHVQVDGLPVGLPGNHAVPEVLS